MCKYLLGWTILNQDYIGISILYNFFIFLDAHSLFINILGNYNYNQLPICISIQIITVLQVVNECFAPIKQIQNY